MLVLIGLLLVGIASFVLGIMSATGRAWVSALVELLAGAALIAVAFGYLP